VGEIFYCMAKRFALLSHMYREDVGGTYTEADDDEITVLPLERKFNQDAISSSTKTVSIWHVTRFFTSLIG
jgi:hypothetical protein